LRGVPFRDRKSDNNVTVKTPTITGDAKTNSVMSFWFSIKLINIMLVSKLTTEIRYENFSEDGLMFVNSHLL
jgi:hypothetical protein